MGCCCLEREEQNQKVPNNQRSFINDKPQINMGSMSQKYKEEGKMYFTQRKYQKAIQSYLNALKNDPSHLPNYTNLALAYRAQKKFYQSIKVIDKMLQLPQSINPNQQNKVFVVKGRILKARSQTFLVKQFCLNESIQVGRKKSAHEDKRQMIESVRQVLTNLTTNPSTKDLAISLKADIYLQTSLKVQKYFKAHFIQNEQQNKILDYFGTRLKSEKAEVTLGKLEGFYENTHEIIENLITYMNEKKKKILQEDDEEDFLIDPISYEQFKTPVIVPSGLTYEEKVLKRHYEKNGTSDPITHEEFNKELGVQNYALQKYIGETRKGISKDDLNYIDY